MNPTTQQSGSSNPAIKRRRVFIERAAEWRYFPPLVLSGIWALMVLLAYPVGDFPLNDTWAYSPVVRRLWETGRLELCHWPEMSLIAHILWGYAVTALFGFSYTVLRCSVAVLGLAGLWGLYALLLEHTRDRRLAALGMAVLAVNPLYFHLACTFMTDVPFLTFAILSYLLLIKGVRRESFWLICGGVLLACWATLIRQVGLVIPASFAVAYAYKHRLRWQTWVMGIWTVAMVGGFLAAYEYWLHITGKTPMNYRLSQGLVLDKLMSGPAAWLDAAQTAVACSIYLGLFLLPILPWLWPGRSGPARRPRIVMLQWVLLLGWTLGVTAIMMRQDRLMPLRMNGSLFYDFGLGPPTLQDVFRFEEPHLPRAPEALMILLTAAGALGGGLLLQLLWRAGWAALSAWIGKRQDALPAWASVMALSAVVMYLLPMAILVPFDRYLLFGVPMLAILLVSVPRIVPVYFAGIRGMLAAGCLVVFAFFGVAATHDYLAWNRARWQAARELMERHKIPPEKIDGGLEFNGVHFYDPLYAEQGGKSWWWVQDDQYIIAFGPLRNYTEFARYRYRRWIPFRHGWIYVLRRHDGGEQEINIMSTRRHGGRNLVVYSGDAVRFWNGDGNSAPVALSYGDYVDLEPGRYTATLYYMARRPRRDHGHGWGQVRLVKFDNGPAIVEAKIDPVETSLRDYRTQAVEFSLEQGMPVELQIIGGDARLWLYRIVVKKTE